VELAAGMAGFLGARLTGAGFGGNTINLVASERALLFAETLAESHASRTGRRIDTRVVRPSDGLSVIQV